MGPGLESAFRAMMYGDMGEEGEPTYFSRRARTCFVNHSCKNGELTAKIKPRKCEIVRESTPEDSSHLDDLEEEQSRRKEGDGRGVTGREQRGDRGIDHIKACEAGTKWCQGQQRPTKEKISTELSSLKNWLEPLPRELEEGEIVEGEVGIADLDHSMNGASYRELEEGEIMEGEVGVADLERVLGDVDKQPFLDHLAHEKFDGSLERLKLGPKGRQYGSFLRTGVRKPSLLFPPTQVQAAVPVDNRDAKILADRILAANILLKRMKGDVIESEHQVAKGRVISKPELKDCGASRAPSREILWELNLSGLGIYDEEAGQQKGGSKVRSLPSSSLKVSFSVDTSAQKSKVSSSTIRWARTGRRGIRRRC